MQISGDVKKPRSLLIARWDCFKSGVRVGRQVDFALVASFLASFTSTSREGGCGEVWIQHVLMIWKTMRHLISDQELWAVCCVASPPSTCSALNTSFQRRDEVRQGRDERPSEHVTEHRHTSWLIPLFLQASRPQASASQTLFLTARKLPPIHASTETPTTQSPPPHPTTPHKSPTCLQDKEVRRRHIRASSGVNASWRRTRLTLRSRYKPHPQQEAQEEGTRARRGRSRPQGQARCWCVPLAHRPTSSHTRLSTQKRLTHPPDKKARDELAGKVGKGKGPLNTGSQGIKKSGKK